MGEYRAEIKQTSNKIVRDAYDSIIASLYLGGKGKAPKTVCLAGCEPNVGKTTVSLGLAVALSQAGYKTVVVDMDFTKDSTKDKELENSHSGVLDFLDSKAEYEKIMYATNHHNLRLIPLGNITGNNFIGLICSSDFDDLYEKLCGDFDFVIFDTSPLDCNAFASVIASICDATFVVAEINRTEKEKLSKEINKLKKISVNIAGIILNKAREAEYRDYLGSYDYFKIRRKEAEEPLSIS